MASIIGDRGRFAIEYALYDRPRPFGSVRLWIADLWIGDFGQTAYLDYFCRKLYFLHSKRVLRTKLAFVTQPSADQLVELSSIGNWSFGEAFDGFNLLYFAVAGDRCLSFRWEMADWLRETHPDYPGGVRVGKIDFNTYDEVVTPFLSHIFTSTVGWDELAPDL
ncbi:hypothetical protein [Tuwongella immobilis]|uniref:Uncharacterized protein n=1 Tax=Tuwongella immobilis TaxID=692036 RepID=A0A6C2YQK8_9BACT|nr:hypothetical protein [Tuwongella immobilis]VIP03766.1 unnamed protein product [Tuwongella immobilis]VTS04900.1 unnamed protein product [Tuwongella immobilis]